ncbi:hypothetical protein BJF90_04425 [Pseudonocardia sp. CNS-004]|nr:hypothetical protein BJF90_04425 [Pseudonocardia sp. CNS-004]
MRTSISTCTNPGWDAARSISSAASDGSSYGIEIPARSRGSFSSHSCTCHSLTARHSAAAYPGFCCRLALLRQLRTP